MKLTIGQEYGGGYIAYLDETGSHGFVVAKPNLNEMYSWKEAMNLCAESRDGDFNDWYLPSKKELDFIYQNLVKKEIGHFAHNTGDYYWSSSEEDNGYAWEQTFYDGYQCQSPKSNKNYICAVRSF